MSVQGGVDIVISAMCDVMQELEACRTEMEKELSSSRTRTPRKKKQSSSNKWIEVLTDLLLGQLSQPSLLWRTVAEQVPS